MRFFLLIGVVATLVATAMLPARLGGPSDVSAAAPRLVVLVTIDALRADHLGIYGYSRPTSPNIDAFARESIVIQDAIAQAPYTKASIASLMTGLYPSAHKTYTTAYAVADAMHGHVSGTPPSTDVLPAAVTTLAEAFKAAGYATAAITTNPFLIADFGFSQGFDTFEFVGGEGFAAADRVLGRALDVINRQRRPLLLWVHLMEPHSPYTPSQALRRELPPLGPPVLVPSSVTIPPWIAVDGSRDVRLYESLYDAEIRTADAAFGTFVAALRERDDWHATALVLTADHGEQFMEHGGFEHNTTLYDELLRVPLIIRVPGLHQRFVESQVELVDVMPTLVGLAGGEVRGTIQGRDLRPMLNGQPMVADPAFAEIVGQQSMVRTREWKLIEAAGGGGELFALARDPREQHPVDHPVRAAELSRVLDALMASAQRAGATIAGETAPISPGTKRRLEALGYLNR
jgi:arylsulfatase A-like enzyme